MRVGEGSRDGSGDCVDELFADDCFDDLALSVVAMVDVLEAFGVTFLDGSDATVCRLAALLEDRGAPAEPLPGVDDDLSCLSMAASVVD